MKQVATLAVLFCGACASSVGAVRQAVSEAPQWWSEAREEIGGQGYPDLGAVPSPTREERPQLIGGAASVTHAASFQKDPRTQGAWMSSAQIKAWAESMKSQFGDIRPPVPSDFAALPTDVFDVPRAKLTIRLPESR